MCDGDLTRRIIFGQAKATPLVCFSKPGRDTAALRGGKSSGTDTKTADPLEQANMCLRGQRSPRRVDRDGRLLGAFEVDVELNLAGVHVVSASQLRFVTFGFELKDKSLRTVIFSTFGKRVTEFTSGEQRGKSVDIDPV